jgi:zinc-ribbon domain
MAFCPECKKEMSATAIVCPHCGYDFSAVDLSPKPARKGFAYSPLADAALIAGMLASAAAVALMGLVTVVALFSGNLLVGLVQGPITCLVLLSLLVVLLRVQKTD